MIVATEGWPFPAITEDYRAQRDIWREVSWVSDEGLSFYDHMLNILPPKSWVRDAFMVGEAADHDKDGMVIYTACVKHRGREYAKDIRADQFDTEVRELLRFLRRLMYTFCVQCERPMLVSREICGYCGWAAVGPISYSNYMDDTPEPLDLHGREGGA